MNQIIDNPALYPILFNNINATNNTGTITERDIKTLIGIFIILNIWWLISLLITTIKHYLNNKSSDFYNESWLSRRMFNIIMILDIFMVTIWGVIILIYLGYLVSSLF